jgi:formylglycine-generating enzyme required for sulfatase activity
MKTLKLAFLLAVTLLPSSRAQEARFFRVVGPAPSTITGITADGHITWTNVPTSGTFTVQTAQSLLNETNWVDYVHVSVTAPVTTRSFYAFMVGIPAGSFTMGATTNMGHEYYLDEVPQHTTDVSAFYMDQYEVPLALWNDAYQWATNHGYSFDNRGNWCVEGNDTEGRQNHPVHCINWYDMVKWCNARSEMEGLTPCYYTDAQQTTIYKSSQLDLTNGCVQWAANGYRLPTEAEWERAARGGAAGMRFPWPDVNTINQSRANYFSYWENGHPAYSFDVNSTAGYPTNLDGGDFSIYTSPVGCFPANGYGLYDMAGNVWECCWDWYDENWYSNAEATQSDTRGPSEALSSRVLRGGSWGGLGDYDASSARCAERDEGTPTMGRSDIGFRCVRGL